MLDLVIDKENKANVGDRVALVYMTNINATISSKSINSIIIGTLDELSSEEPFAVIDGTPFDLANEGETSILLKIKE